MHIIGLFFRKLVQGSVNEFEENAEKNGISGGLSKVLKKYHTRINSFKSQETEKVLQNESCILISNHPYIIDPIPLMSTLPERDDFFVLMYDFMTGVSKNLDKHIIPLNIKHHINEKKLGLVKILAKSLDTKTSLTKEEAHLKNIGSIGQASQKISDGGLVLIFPFPEMLKNNGLWFNGVGFLVNEVKNKNKTYVIFANINGTSGYDIFRLIPIVNFFMPAIKIKFSSPFKLNELLPNKVSSQEITQLLEKSYNDWK